MASDQLLSGRICIAGMCLAAAKAALSIAIRYSATRLTVQLMEDSCSNCYYYYYYYLPTVAAATVPWLWFISWRVHFPMGQFLYMRNLVMINCFVF